MLIAGKKEVEEEIDWVMKTLLAEKWSKIAKNIVSSGGKEYKPAALEKKWDQMLKKSE